MVVLPARSRKRYLRHPSDWGAFVLAIMAFSMVMVFMFLIMTKRMAPMIALIVVPLVFAVLGGFARGMGAMMLDGVRNLAPTGVMLMFAILYFAIMSDAGLFEPLVGRIVRFAHGDPLKVIIGTVVLALVVSLDGDGSTTYMILVAAMLPLYRGLGVNPLILACVTMVASGIMNITPWGGPTARAASALGIDPSDIFVPMVPAMIGSAAWLLFVGYRFGLRERARLGAMELAGPLTVREPPSVLLEAANADDSSFVSEEIDPMIRRPNLRPINGLLTAALMVALVTAVLPLPVLFMIGFAIAMMINYPSIAEQKARIAAHAGNILAVVGLIFAAGIFTGILSGTKMVDAMAASVIQLVPPSMGPYLAPITGLLSIPFTFFISNDAFYYGVLPILAKAAAGYGISPAEIGRASIIGQPVHLLSPLVPSTYLLVGLIKLELGDHQRFTLKWAALTSLVMLAVGVLGGVIPWVGRAVR